MILLDSTSILTAISLHTSGRTFCQAGRQRDKTRGQEERGGRPARPKIGGGEHVVGRAEEL